MLCQAGYTRYPYTIYDIVCTMERFTGYGISFLALFTLILQSTVWGGIGQFCAAWVVVKRPLLPHYNIKGLMKPSNCHGTLSQSILPQ